MEQKFYRHGDVLLRKVERPEQLVTEVDSTETHIVASGEATGHHHRLTALGGAISAMTGFDDRRYVEVMGGLATLSHEEHSALSIEPGFYEITIEQEWDYFTRAARTVLD